VESAFAKASADGIYRAYHGLSAAKIAGEANSGSESLFKRFSRSKNYAEKK
jgi:hypothetical protein